MKLKLSQVRDIVKNGGLMRALEIEKEHIDALIGNTSGQIKSIINFYSGTLPGNKDDGLPNSCQGCNDSINNDVLNKLIEEIKVLRKNRLIMIFFEIISRKIRRGNFYSSENLLEKLDEILRKIFQNTEISIYAYIGGRNGVIDCVNKQQNGRKVFSSIDNLDYSNEIRLGLESHKKFIATSQTSGLICYKPTPELGDAVIFHFKGCCQEELEMIKYLMEALSEIIIQGLEKINDRYISEVTGCKSKKYYIEHREDRNMSAIAFDLNNFKSLNDIYGHAQGDKVLRKFGKALKGCVRENEGEVIHFSGDEFGIVLKSGDNNDFGEVMNIVLDRIEEKNKNGGFMTTLIDPETGEDIEINIDFALGHCTNKFGRDNMTLGECYEQADLDMLRNKDPKGFENRLIEVFKHFNIETIRKILGNIAKYFNI